MKHTLDIWPLPKGQTPMFINEPWLIDESIYFETAAEQHQLREPDDLPDNIRVYIPLDLNGASILRRLDYVINKYNNKVTWKNESNFSTEVAQIINHIEIYDQIWFVREGEFPTDQNGQITGHSTHAKKLVKEFISRLEQIDSSEDFPYMTIDELQKDYYSV